MDDLDRILSSEARLTPSPEFTTTVMAAIHRQAGAPPPLPFPWRRAAFGGGACLALTLGTLLVATLSAAVPGGAASGGGAVWPGGGAGAAATLLRAQFVTWPPTVPALLLLSLAGSYLAIRLSLRPARE
jgi:hypothetical protein